MKSTENWLLAEFIPSYHRYSLPSDEAFWKMEASFRTPIMSQTLHFERELSKVSIGSLPDNERLDG